MITTIVKRDGRQVPFNLEKIANAIFKALQAVGAADEKQALGLPPRPVANEKAHPAVGVAAQTLKRPHGR